MRPIPPGVIRVPASCASAWGEILPGFLSVLAIALLPAGGNIIGTAIAEVARPQRWVVGAALHMAAGVAVALVSVELLPRVLGIIPPWLIVLLFGAGAVVSVLLAKAVIKLRGLLSARSSGAWLVFMATAVDLLSDGVMIGAGSAVSGDLGLLLALSQVVGNIPGGFATIANFRSQSVSRRIRIIAAISFVVPVAMGAGLGFWLLRGAGGSLQAAALAVIVGILLVTTIEDLVPQADKPGTARSISTAAFVGGFAFFTLLALYLD